MTPQPDLSPSPAGGASGSESQGLVGRLSGIYFSPSETYPGIGRAPRVLLPLILVAILGAFSSYILTQRVGFENLVRKQMEPMVERGWMTQEQADEAIRQSTTGTRATIGKLQGPIGLAIVTVLIVLALTGLFKLFSMIVGVENQFKPLLGVTAWTFLAISILQTILFAIVLYLKSPDEIDLINPVGSNLTAVLSLVTTSIPKYLKALLTWVDLFTIWRIILLSIGYAAVSGKMKVSTAATGLIILFGVAALIISAVMSLFA